MNIKDVIVYCISTDLEKSFMFSQGVVNKRSSTIIEIITDDGTSGWGESLCHGMQPPQISASFITHCFKPMLLGRSIFDVEVLWEEMYNRSRPFGQMGAAINAMSGIDIAIWDAIGRTVGRPIYELLGGKFRDSVDAYATGFYRVADAVYPRDAILEAKQHVENNFRALKVKVGFGVEKDIAYIKALRDAVDDNIILMADFNCAYNQAAARRIIKALADEKIYFYEELLSPEDIQGYKAIRNLSSSYIAAGENLFGKIVYKDWIEQDALDILQPDICSCGGITDCKKIMSIAQAHNMRIIPHVWGSIIGLAASLQFIANIAPTPMSLNPIEPMLEYDQSTHPFRSMLADSVFTLDADGRVKIPNKPGIGIHIHREKVKEYTV